MTRERTPNKDGWITVGVKLRLSDVQRLDAARGATARSEWIRKRVQATLGTLEELHRAEALAGDARLRQAVADAGLDKAEKTAGARTRPMTDQEAHEFYKDPEHLRPAGPGRKLQRDCTHPKARRSKGGLCMACGQNVEK